MMENKVYLLLTGSMYCHDMDELFGIFTDKIKLKESMETLIEWNKDKEYPDTIFVYSFPINEFTGKKCSGYFHGQYETYVLDGQQTGKEKLYRNCY